MTLVPGPAHVVDAVDRVSNLDQIISDAANRHGISPGLLRAVGMQETGLGNSPVYDSRTGLSRTPGNHGHGIWQLDPASGASAQDLARAAQDPSFAADRAASMLSGFIKQHGGDLHAALEAYNGGGAGYADSVLGFMRKASHLQLAGDLVPGPAPKRGLVAGPAPKTKAPQPSHKSNDSIVSKAINAVRPGAMRFAHAVADTVDEPIQLLNDVLGAPQRFVAGAMQQDVKHNKPQFGRSEGTYKNPVDQLVHEVGGGVYGVFHPNDRTVQSDAEKSLGADKLKTNDARFRGKARNFATDLGFQTLTDPLTYVMGPTRTAGEALVKGASELGEAGLRSGNKLVQNFAGTFIPHASEKLAFTPKGKAAVIGIRNSEDLNVQRMAHEDSELLKKYKTEIAKGNVPDAVRQRLLREAYVYGTPSMRRQAVQFGYHATPEEAAKKPLGVLNYTLRADYFPHVGKYKMPEEYQEVGKAYNIKPNARFEKQQTTDELPADPLQSMEYRLQSGRAAIRQRSIQKRVAEETGLPMTVGMHRIAPDIGKQSEHVQDLKLANELLHGTHGGERVQGLDWIKAVSNVGRDTLIGANPVPHAKNIASLAYVSGGVPVVQKGLQYALSGIPQSLRDRLEKYGAGTHFMLTQSDSISPVRVLPWRKASQASLDRIDMGMRAARLEQIDKQYPHLSEYQKAEKVNEDIGAYKDSPAYVEFAKNWLGAQFPQWHAYIVPTTIARAIVKNPQRVESIVRGTNDLNQDVVGEKAGYKIDPGGPVSEAANLYADPLRVANLPYAELPKGILSPSSSGAIGAISQLTHKAGEGISPLAPGGFASELIPYFSIIAPQFGYNAFNSKAPPNVRSMAAFFAAYPKAEKSAREMMVRSLMESGIGRFKAEQQAQRAFGSLRRYLR